MSIQKLFDSNGIFAGNPSLLSLEGVRVLAYHGRSMDDLVSAIPGLSYQRPLDGMKAMLRLRHLAPIYGGKRRSPRRRKTTSSSTRSPTSSSPDMSTRSAWTNTAASSS